MPFSSGWMSLPLSCLTMVVLLLCWSPGGSLKGQEAGLIVTVFDERTGEPLKNLQVENFTVQDGSSTLTVLEAAPVTEPLDILLLLDGSMVGEPTRPVSIALVNALKPDEQVAIAGFHESADLLQDFTSDKNALHRAIDRIEYRGTPRVVDALFASIDGGFETRINRKVIILVSAGVEGSSRIPEGEVVADARAKQVSIYSVFVRAYDRGLFKRLSMRTGGAYFLPKQLKLDPENIGHQILESVRHSYELTVSGVYSLGDNLKVSVSGPLTDKKKILASALAVD